MSIWNPAQLRIMIVDDQPATRSLLKRMLKELQIQQVIELPDGREALDFLDLAPDMVDLVICDWNMPNLTGIELLRQVRSVGLEIPFLMLTGRGDEGSVIEARDCGVSAYVLKPFSRDQLEAKLRIALSKKSRVARW